MSQISRDNEMANDKIDLKETDFTILAQEKYFVDKTLLIKKIVEEENYRLLLTAPHGFGKTTNFSMLKAFLQVPTNEFGEIIDYENSTTYKIFQQNNLNIYRIYQEFFRTHFGRYAVIYVSFKFVNGRNIKDFLEQFQLSLRSTYRMFPYLLDSPKLNDEQKVLAQKYYNYGNGTELVRVGDIKIGLSVLSELVSKHFDGRRVYLFVDDYDTPLTNAMLKLDCNYYREVQKFLVGMIYNRGLKTLHYFQKRILMGTVTGLLQDDRLPCVSLNTNYDFLDMHDYVKYFGLTSVELQFVFKKYRIDNIKRNEVKAFYGGYDSKSGIKLFSFCTILNYLKERELKPFWELTDFRRKLSRELNGFDQIRYCIARLLRGVFLDTNITSQNSHEKNVHIFNLRLDTFIFLLLQEGFLTYDGRMQAAGGGTGRFALKLVNEEMKNHLNDHLNDYYITKYNYLNMVTVLSEFSTNFENIFENDTINQSECRNFFEKFNELIEEVNLERKLKSYFHILWDICAKTPFALYKIGDQDCLGLRKDDLDIKIKLIDYKNYPNTSSQQHVTYTYAIQNKILFLIIADETQLAKVDIYINNYHAKVSKITYNLLE